MTARYPFQGSGTARRPVIMWAAQRAPAAAWGAMAARTTAHAAIGAPATITITAVTAALLAAGTPGLGIPAAVTAAGIYGSVKGKGWFIANLATVAGTAWIFHAVFFNRAGAVAAAVIVTVSTTEFYMSTIDPYMSTWRKGWAFRRLWPNRAAAADYGTGDMRASLGGGGISNFLQASKNLPRPVMNHPPIGRPQFGWRNETVTFNVGPPGSPGAQTVDDIATLLPSIIEGYNFVTDITLDTETGDRPTLTAWFNTTGDDHLADQVTAELDRADPLDTVKQSNQ